MKNLNFMHLFNMKLILLLFVLFFSACSQPNESQLAVMVKKGEPPIAQTDASTVVERFPAPNGFTTFQAEENSFAHFLQYLPLKPAGAKVAYYNGGIKTNYGIYKAVVDLPIGNKDLHQCADAVMRLRADYLKSIGKENDIAFHFTNGFLCDYKTWKSGKRPAINGNKVTWANGNKHKDDYWKYMEMVFSYAGTLSLEKELKPKAINEIEIGDVFIRGGSPGHAVIVVNLAQNAAGEKKFMLAQSYMPAQELQILNNPKNNTVWFTVPTKGQLITPEWVFDLEKLRSF